MAVESAGLLLYRRRNGGPELLLAHMGGPLWARREERAWTIVKGEIEPGEEAIDAALREFAEETGSPPPDGPLLELGEVRQSGGKRVLAWALEGELDPDSLRSSTFEIEWPPRSGRQGEFPEIDRVGWWQPARARELLVAAQAVFVDRLLDALAGSP